MNIKKVQSIIQNQAILDVLTSINPSFLNRYYFCLENPTLFQRYSFHEFEENCPAISPIIKQRLMNNYFIYLGEHINLYNHLGMIWFVFNKHTNEIISLLASHHVRFDNEKICFKNIYLFDSNNKSFECKYATNIFDKLTFSFYLKPVPVNLYSNGIVILDR